MAKSKKAKAKRTASVVKDCVAVQNIKELASQIAAISLPAGTPDSVKARIGKIAGRVVIAADGIQKSLGNSKARIERAAKRKAALEKKIADATALLKEMDK